MKSISYSDGHHRPQLEARYFERMASSLGDKQRIIGYLPDFEGASVLDVGAGGGELSNALSGLGYEVTSIDASDDAVMRLQDKYPHLTTHQLLANHAHSIGDEKFDAIVCSSILHEVFSYGDDQHSKGEYASLDSAFESFRRVLKSGGKLIIRDGVLPENWQERGTITLGEEHDSSVVETYLKMCPFSNGHAGHETGSIVQLNKIGDKTYEGNARSLMEFAYTYTWGLESYPRETQELYGVKTLKEYEDLLASHGFTVTEAYEYLQPGYPENLKEKMTLNMSGKINEWFSSNAIWVAVKQVKPRRTP